MSEVLAKLAPIYIIIVVGVIANRFLSLDKKSLAELNIYVLAPIVTFSAIQKSELALSSLVVLTLMFLTATLIYSICFYLVGFLIDVLINQLSPTQ